MEAKKYIVIFSHGFGTKKDDRGLLSGEHGIAEALESDGIETVLFDYNDVDESTKTITTIPMSMQVEMLAEVIRKNKEENEGAIIDIIAHSQGCLVPASLLPTGIRKTIFIAPSLDVNNQRMIDQFKDRPGTVIDIEGVSKFCGRKDGTITIVPRQYWKDREKAQPIPLYNELSKITDITIIRANQDDILGNLDISGLAENIKLIYLDGDHSFNEATARARLIETTKTVLRQN